MMSRRGVLLVAAAAVGLCVASCTNIDPTPFQTFHQGAETLRDSVQKIESTVIDETRSRELAEIAAAPERFPDLELQFGDPSFDWSYPTDANDPLVFAALESRAQTARELNDLFAAYAGLLADLAAVQITDDEVDTQAQKIESSAQGVLEALDETPATGEVAFLTNVFLTGVQAYVERRQKRLLEEVLQAQQPNVERFAEMGQSLMEDSALDLADEYQRSFQAIQRQVAITTEVAGRQTLVQQAVALNDDVTQNLEVVRQLHATYASLPDAHAQLARDVREGRGVSRESEISEFVRRATRLAKLYDDLREPATPVAPADPAPEDTPQD